MKTNTSITIDEHVLNRVREVSNGNISSFMERAARHELMYLAGQAVADWERRQGNDVEARALADLELQQVAIRQALGEAR
ncbi:hypothetical protein [Nocardia crassostreae]|uniref:hypothetical protein n=1 Tax=Nocardia crassostreae TaxID=53428 RepID=UPI00082EE58F|nr:hypothetical protein [Nocardia crassostreae]